MSNERYGDFLTDTNDNVKAKATSTSTKSSVTSSKDTELLQDIDKAVNNILGSMGRMSQSAAKSSIPGNKSGSDKWKVDRGYKTRKGAFDSFTDGIEDALLESLGASDFKKQIQGALNQLAKDMGTSVSDLPNMLGKELGKNIMNSGPGKAISDTIRNFTSNMFQKVANAYDSGKDAKSYSEAFQKGLKNFINPDKAAASPESKDASDAVNKAQQYNDLVNTLKSKASGTSELLGKAADKLNAAGHSKIGAMAGTASQALSGLGAAGEGAAAVGEVSTLGAAAAETTAAATSTSAAMAGLTAAMGEFLIPLVAIPATLYVLDKAFEALTPAVEGFKNMMESAKATSNRYQESRKKNLELQKERIAADVETLIKEPFQILSDAANELYQAWDSQLRTISATQGYNKADVQDLMSAYAQRLRSEGLTSVVSTSDIMTNLSNVLKSGLSGQVAEEFSYLATKLNAAVPTQDFFSYADTYASVAANAIAAGKTQQEAIEYANSEMEQFASNVLYASRQLSGGFSSGLKNAQTLFEESVQIANASKTGNVATISGVLTSISAVAGAIAPDLADGIVQAVVKAATGGNASEIVALRSLAGVNASNTEFLKALAQNPQEIFETLFKNLANLQNMSNDNFMEVAEGLSSVFGISMDAFARIDFNYLADQIANMNVNSASLDENIKLLASGQTTTSQEQMKMAQINKYMLDEGLSYVLDNAAARSIQEHMWQEQIARELQESKYAVELQGAALDFLEGIRQTVDNIKNFLNPFAFLQKLSNLVSTAEQSKALKADTRQLLELGKVGKGNPQSLYNLTTSNKNLNLVAPLVELMGGASAYQLSKSAMDRSNNAFYATGSMDNSLSTALGQLATLNKINSPTSRYTWAGISKSAATSVFASPMNSTGLTSTLSGATTSEDLIKARSNRQFQRFLNTMQSAVTDKHLTYDEWAATSKRYGIKDLSDALEKYGRSEQELRGAFANQEATAASEYQHQRNVTEDNFWQQGLTFFDNQQANWLTFEKLLTDNQTSMINEMLKANAQLIVIQNTQNRFFTDYLTDWRNYYIKHSAYSEATLNSYKAADIIKSEKQENGDAVLALAQALTQNTIGIQEGFKDPVVQTNVLLSKILIVIEAIMQQNNSTGGLSLPDALSALSLGMTNKG